MNILYIVRRDPREVSSGTEQRTHILWKALSKIGTVYTVVLANPFLPRKNDEEARIHEISLKSPLRLVWYIQAFLSLYLRDLGWPFRSKRYIRSLFGWPDVSFDLVVTRYVKAAAETSAWRYGPCFVDVDDLPQEAYAAAWGVNHSALRRWISSALIKTWTRYALRRCKGAWVPNRFQIDKVDRYCPCGYLPNLAMPVDRGYRVDGTQKMQLMSVGVMGYGPNREGVDWFLKEIWPAVHERFPSLVYAIAGGSLPEDFRARWTRIEGIRVLGFVEDIDALYQESLAVVTPIRGGAGTCIKVLEAVARGRKLLATPVSVRGLTDEELAEMDISRFETAEEFCSALDGWLRYSDEERRARQADIASAGAPFCERETFDDLVRGTLETFLKG